MENNRNVAILIGAFVSLLIGISLIGVVATSAQDITTLTYTTESFDQATEGIRLSGNESAGDILATGTYSIDQATTGTWKADDSDCVIDVTFVGNSTGVAGGAAGTLTETTDYTITDAGVLSLVGSAEVLAMTGAGVDNTTYIYYNYCPDDYLSQGWTRSVTDLVPGFFGIALLLVSVGLFYQVLKNEGLVGI